MSDKQDNAATLEVNANRIAWEKPVLTRLDAADAEAAGAPVADVVYS